MQGSWNNGKPHYRCVFPKEYAQANGVPHPRSVYVREELVVEPLDEWLATVFDPGRLPETIRTMAAAQLTDDHRLAAVESARQAVADCERKLAGYRALVNAGTDPAVVVGWITETEARRKVEQSRLKEISASTPKRLSEQEIATIVSALGDLRRLLRSVDPHDKMQVYRQLGLRMTYEPGRKTVIARTEVGRSCSTVCPRGEPHQFHMPLPSPGSSCWGRGRPSCSPVPVRCAVFSEQPLRACRCWR
ncbi:hypothetical protein [Sphaerisporangium sp. TRM90804]|uniref:hypothetical protein n=1 Tax=Sphaerisporangium sp. TRM90804 TaxID=3031113 RepID=UPI00244C045F|nr:hypothetical protein [Sphaerisporangium sp. TRM90804]MDH2426429.1 hypothetical protein [Sphaerisporangium sp. TRM90804]